MTPRVEQPETFTMLGVAVRTSNAKEAADSQIGKQWGRLFQENLLGAIPNRADLNVLALYTDYASDKDGEYTFVLGARVTKTDAIPAGMVAKTVPAGKYAVFTSERGPVQKVVVAAWRRIWPRRRMRLAEIAPTKRILSCTTSGHKTRRMRSWRFISASTEKKDELF